jgi:hypothetical protein
MIPKSGYRFPAFAKPANSQSLSFSSAASADEGRSGKIMLK